MSKWQDNRDEALRNVTLSLDGHAEDVTVIRGIGKLDRVEWDQAIVDSTTTMRVSVSEDEDTFEAEDGEREERISVLCGRTDSMLDSNAVDLGGLSNPTIHDGILRDAAHDPEQRVYLFRREKEHASTLLQRLVFARYVVGHARGPE